MAAEQGSRRQLLRWIGWFGAANAGLYLLIVSRYLWDYPFTSDLPGNVYVLLAFVGHSAVLACIPLFLIVMPVALVWPSRRLVSAVAVIVSSFGLSLLFLDTNVFAENRFHLTGLTLELFEWSTWVFSGVFFVIVLAFESLLAGLVRGRLAAGPPPVGRVRGAWVGIGLAVCWLASQALHIWGDAVAHTPVTRFTRYMPLYYPLHAKRDLARLGLVDPEQVQKRRLLRGSVDTGEGQLRYPLQPMNCRAAKESLPNILIILIDALRPDAIHPELMPHLSEFSRHALRFTQQYSGGNSSRMGIFSLFYGLPSTYWQSFYDLQRSPVLMDQVRDNGYQVGLFSAVGFGSPTLIDRTVFAGWPDLPGDRADLGAVDRNRTATDDWLNWLSERNTGQPVFGFLYYDPPIRVMSAEKPAGDGDSLPMEDRFTGNPDAEDEWRRYRRAMQTVDRELGRVLDSMSSRSLLDDTIIIVTSDHGYEFDDNGLGYIGHASAFSSAQLIATMIIAWPGKEPAEIRYRTTHHDLPVTLLQDVFGCENPPREYSIGRNLFSGVAWEWMMAGSYSAHAIVEPDRVIVSHPGGFVEVRDRNYQPVSGSDLNADLIQASMEAQSRFFR